MVGSDKSSVSLEGNEKWENPSPNCIYRLVNAAYTLLLQRHSLYRGTHCKKNCQINLKSVSSKNSQARVTWKKKLISQKPSGRARKETNLQILVAEYNDGHHSMSRLLEWKTLYMSNVVIRNYLVTLQLFLKPKCSLSLWSELTIGHGKWFLNTNLNLFFIKTFLITKVYCTLKVYMW